MEKRCTTCHYFLAMSPERVCGHPYHHVRLKEVHNYCKNYINMLAKDQQDRPLKKTFDETLAMIDANNA